LKLLAQTALRQQQQQAASDAERELAPRDASPLSAR